MRSFPARCGILLALLLAAILVACDSALPSPTPEPTPRPGVTPTPTVEPTPTETFVMLRVWLPEALSSTGDDEGARVLRDILGAFDTGETDTLITVAAKKAAGPGGLLDLLRAASPVAPDALPDLILLSDADLAIAAREGLIQPLDDLLPASSEADLYTFARDAARIDRKRMGLPVAADINHLVYRPETFDFPPGDWDALISDTLEYPFAFVDGAHVSDAVLSDYALLGGAVINAEGQPALTLEALTQLLALYRDARVAGTLSTEYLNWPDEGAAWAAFTASDATLTVVRASRYLAERATGGDLQHARVPAIDGARSLPIGRSWNLAIVTRDPRRQSIAARLIEHWSRVENLAAWTQAEHVLPASAEALSRWDAADGYVTFVRGELSRAVAPPSPAALDAIGPAFLTAIRDVLTGRVAPQAAATAAVDTVARGIR